MYCESWPFLLKMGFLSRKSLVNVSFSLHTLGKDDSCGVRAIVWKGVSMVRR